MSTSALLLAVTLRLTVPGVESDRMCGTTLAPEPGTQLIRVWEVHPSDTTLAGEFDVRGLAGSPVALVLPVYGVHRYYCTALDEMMNESCPGNARDFDGGPPPPVGVGEVSVARSRWYDVQGRRIEGPPHVGIVWKITGDRRERVLFLDGVEIRLR